MARRNKFSLSNFNLFTGEMGTLMPIQVLEVLPGDTIECQTKALLRVTPLAAPVYHKVDVRIHHWNVPNRITADNDGKDWETFITGGPNGNDTSTVPTIATSGIANDMFDYMGLTQKAGINVSVQPIRAFNFIYNEFYRDQDMVVERELNDTTIPNIAWEKDYFTTCRPFSQRGPSVTLPIADKARVATDANTGVDMSIFATIPEEFRGMTSANPPDIQLSGAGAAESNQLYADLASATGINAIEFREFFALQRFAEARSRYGARYTEYLRYIGSNYKGTLNRPEYLGGGTKSIDFSEIMQTSPDVTGPEERHEFGVGDLYGHGISAMKSNRFRRTIDEHGYIISLLSVRPKAVYSDGIERHWLKLDREDFFQKELEAVGQMEVLQNEVFGEAANDQAVFGFQDRYQEYRWARPHICNQFRDTFDYWHMARIFENAPALNQQFTDCVPTKRIYNEQSQHPLWVMANNVVKARRVVGKNVQPRLM